MGRRRSTSRNCAESEQMLKQTLFCCFISFFRLIILPLQLSFSVQYSYCYCYLAHLASKPACPWMCCHHNRTASVSVTKNSDIISAAEKFAGVTFYSAIIFHTVWPIFLSCFLLLQQAVRKLIWWGSLFISPLHTIPKLSFCFFSAFTGAFEYHKLLNLIIFSRPLFSCEM